MYSWFELGLSEDSLYTLITDEWDVSIVDVEVMGLADEAHRRGLNTVASRLSQDLYGEDIYVADS